MTTPGPTLIYECKHCKKPFRMWSISSGNTFRARYRSDGRMYAPMLPMTPPIVACPHCKAPLGLFEMEPIATFRTYMPGLIFSRMNGETPSAQQLAYKAKQEELATTYEDTSYYDFAGFDQCLEFINASKLDNGREKNLRQFALWLSNDERFPETVPSKFRDNGRVFLRQLEPKKSNQKISDLSAVDANIERLITLLDEESQGEVLLKAELQRELGQFDLCKNLLNRDVENGAAAEQILRRAERCEASPFLMAGADDIYEFEYAWIARRYKPETVPTNFDELDPPIFKINNRDWFVKVLGMLSHRWALTQENTDRTATVYFFNDHSARERPAVIDSKDFPAEDDAYLWLLNEGFESLKAYPGPWMGCEPKGYIYDAREQ